MTTLITGANGFLGKHVVAEFEKYKLDYLKPTSRELDLTNISSTMDYFDKHRPSKVLHMAAACGGLLANKNSPADFIHANAKMAVNVFESVHKYNVKYLYTLGSVCMYPANCPIPFKEEDLWNGYPEETNAPYGMAKRLSLSMQQAYNQQYGLKGAHFMLVNLYGEHDSFDLTNSHVIPALIRKFFDAIDTGKTEVQFWGTGKATRELFYAGDCAEALCKAVRSNFNHNQPINLGTGVSISIHDLAYLVARLVGYHGKIVFSGEVSDGQMQRQLNVDRARDLLGFVAKTPLMKGLVRTICWYQDNKERINGK